MIHYKCALPILKKLNFETVSNNKKVEFLNIESGFDIETTSINKTGKKTAFMYVWQMGIGLGNPVFYGRTWDELLDCLEQISEFYELSESKRLVIYVHNLGYEFQFFKHYFEWLDVFAVDERKPLKALTSLGIEFRDSYILSGYSLANTAKNLTKFKVEKMVGDLDYSLVRTHKTKLTDKEIKYCENDILIILSYIKEQILILGNITDIPLTNTGRVRQYVRKNCYQGFNKKSGKAANYARYKKIMNDLTLDENIYTQLKRAFMGGFTHANSNMVGKVLNDVSSIDFTSSYPYVMVSDKFPMSRFKPYEPKTINDFTKDCDEYAIVFDIKLTGITPKITQENYLSTSKCHELQNPIVNNGRVNSADLLTATLTNVDFKIMAACYNWETISISNAFYAHLGYLPKPIITSILNLYQDKTELKDVEGFEVEYLLSKGMLNSIYGMSVTDVVKDETFYEGDTWYKETPYIPEKIDEYNNSRNRFLYYAWGIWVTAYARLNLWTGILAVKDDYIYSDTDSLKLLNHDKHIPYIEWYNKKAVSKLHAMADYYNIDRNLFAPKTIKGIQKPLGVWDFEGCYSRFKTLGAKRYLVEENEKLTLTVAGLSKQNGVKYMIKKANGDNTKVFEMFDNSLYIPVDETGKMTHTYIDEPQTLKVKDYKGNSKTVHTLSGVHLEPCDFTLSISTQFNDFLKNLSNGYIFKGVKHV